MDLSIQIFQYIVLEKKKKKKRLCRFYNVNKIIINKYRYFIIFQKNIF